MKQYIFRIYIIDTDGSERLGTVVVASTKQEATRIAKVQGYKKIFAVEKHMSIERPANV